jgi:hypothetical protein
MGDHFFPFRGLVFSPLVWISVFISSIIGVIIGGIIGGIGVLCWYIYVCIIRLFISSFKWCHFKPSCGAGSVANSFDIVLCVILPLIILFLYSLTRDPMQARVHSFLMWFTAMWFFVFLLLLFALCHGLDPLSTASTINNQHQSTAGMSKNEEEKWWRALK